MPNETYTPQLVWDEVGERLYETGIRNVVLYNIDENNAYSKGVAWSGVTKIDDKPTGGEVTDLYADDTIYLSMTSLEKYESAIEAYMSPVEFDRCDGSAELTTGVTIGQQARETFGLCYRGALGNDIKGTDYGYILHLVYGCKAQPSEKSHETINDSPTAATMSWEIKTTPVAVKGFKPTSHVQINSTKVDPEKLALLESVLYGKAATDNDPAVDARLPLPDEVKAILEGTVNP